MYLVCIFTDESNKKFIVAGGNNKEEVYFSLSKSLGSSASLVAYNKLVMLKHYLSESDGKTYLELISKLNQKELFKLLMHENGNLIDLSKHLNA
ncbi:MAG: hypothetical protein LC111_05685 [Bacteroidia bacterium]|nr:hypothetical protein [Bacteroidia bacterium]